MKIAGPRFFAAAAVLAVALTGYADANAPTGRYTITGGKVYDTKTKLTWQQAAGAAMSQGDANILCGNAGMRLPTIRELHTIVDYSQSAGPLIDRNAFPGTPSSSFWSATPNSAGLSFGAWFLDFSDGTSDYGDSSSTGLARNVRCVD